MDALYSVSSSEKIHDLEKELSKELAELKNEMEENEMVDGLQPRAISSVPMPKGVEYFRHERKMVIDRALQVSEAHPLKIQADVMKEELNICDSAEYTPTSIPLLLHQYFLDRAQQLVQCKHLHMLRWKRFCEHTSIIEALYPAYQKRLTSILSEYNDCVQRAQRLAVTRESLLSGGDAGLQAIKSEDLHIYLRWMVCHLHSTKTFHQFFTLLQWIPIWHKSDMLPSPESSEEDISSSSKIVSRYQDESSSLLSRPRSVVSRPGSAASFKSPSPIIPAAPPINVTIMTTNPLPVASFTYAAAATGGGLSTEEHTLGIPCHMMEFMSLKPHLNFLLNIYGVNVELEQINTTADEMEIYALVNRKFKQIFLRQETMKTFKTYDRLEFGQEEWGSESFIKALKQESNWLPYVTLNAVKDPWQEKKWVQIRQKKKVDELLKHQSRFLQITDADRVQDVLRDYATVGRGPGSQPGVSYRSRQITAELWKKIYSNSEVHRSDGQESSAPGDLDERDVENVTLKSQSRVGSAHKRKESYDYLSTVQMLGLDDGDTHDNDPASVQGAYLSFLHLRHLRIRDLQRSCLSILNYFRSIERTITINDGGLSLSSGRVKNASPQNHRKGTESDGTLGGGGGLGYHGYLHNTPVDFKLSESEFMEFSDVDNHDDFYTFDEGRIHVQDQRGYYIVYDSAMEDFKKLSEDLLLLGSYYIEKDKDLRNTSGKGSTAYQRAQLQEQIAGDFDIPTYSHQDVDRLGVLMDLWTNEASFLECKRELLDVYTEVYQHVFDRDEKRAIAQVITDVMHKEPHFDFNSNYFVKAFRSESVCLRCHSNLVKSILDKQIEEQRDYVQRVSKEGDPEFGLPHRNIPKQPIAVNGSRSILKNVFMLEFHPSLAVISKLPEALDHAFNELVHIHKPDTVSEKLYLKKRFYEIALKDWTRMEKLGSSFSAQVQKDLFSDVFMEDPTYMCEVAQAIVSQQDQIASRRTQKEKQLSSVQSFCKLMETVLLRHRLLDAAWETEVLAKIYRQQAHELKFEEYHMFLRFVQFEFASHRESADRPVVNYIMDVLEDDSCIDRYMPSSLNLAIHELDEGHVGRFSFRSRESLMQILQGTHIESLQVILKCQIVQKNALISAIQQADACFMLKHSPMDQKSGRTSPTDTKSEKSTITQYTGFSSVTQGTAHGSKSLSDGAERPPRLQGSFVSLQVEKAPSRNLMLNEYIAKKQLLGTIMKNPEEVEKIKRRLLSDYCLHLNTHMIQFSLRAQIISYYNSIHQMLEGFPRIMETYFVVGDEKNHLTKDDPDELIPDPRVLKKRPNRLLSADGHHVLNIWFIPHHVEVLLMFKALDDEARARALTHSLMIVGMLHDILQYLCSHSKLGITKARLGSNSYDLASADWGGTDGIGSELRDIQKQLNALPLPTDPAMVAEYLTLRRDVMFLEFDAAVRHSMVDTFISTGNLPAFKAVSCNIHQSLPRLSNVMRPSVLSTYHNIPEPLEACDLKVKEIFPYRSFLGRNGPYPLQLWQWHMIDYNLQLCLAGLKDVDRYTANGEILGVSLLMEDILQSGQHDHHALSDSSTQNSPHPGSTPASSRPPSSLGMRSSTSKERLHDSRLSISKKPLSRSQEPIEAYKMLKGFLLLWKRLELIKLDWGKRKLVVQRIDSLSTYKEYCKLYRSEVLLPVMQSIARRLGRGDMYEGLVLDTDPLVMPAGVSEIEIRSKQLVKLLENLECHMINEVRKKLSRELTLVLSERAREEGALPTDLWKRPVMKESYTIARPHIAEDFAMQLMADCQEDEEGGKMTFSRSHLSTCIAELARTVMKRERQNYDSYTMYYENLLRIHHQLLYQREQEIKQVRDQLKSAQTNTLVEVQCELADQAYDLLTEITALRAKISEMREQSLTTEQDIRERLKLEYDDLVQSLFNLSFQLKTQFDIVREDMCDDVLDKIKETKTEAAIAMSKVKEKDKGSAEEEIMKINVMKEEKFRAIQHDNHTLQTLVMKMKAMNTWRSNHNTGNFMKTITNLKKKSERSKKEFVELKMIAEEEIVLLRQQLVAVRKALAVTEGECYEKNKIIEKELKSREEKSHEAQQRARSQKQLEQAKQANVEKLLEELEDKELRLRMVSEQKKMKVREQQMIQEKAKREVTSVKKQLEHERSLKLDAFQRVDELQAQRYDMESVLLNRSQSAITLAPSMPITGKTRSRAASATHRRSIPSHGVESAMSLWPPGITWPNRSMTPAERPDHSEQTKIQRPKTVGGRLRSRITEQLLYEIERNPHQTLIELK